MVINEWIGVIKKLIIGGFSLTFSAIALANPVLNNIGAGNVKIQQTPGVMTIQQSTPRAILNWKSFNINRNEATHFLQPNGGITLNRISPTQGVSQIYGTLTATGRIILVNPAGIYFGPSAYVNVGGLIATTANITDRNFLQGNYQFLNASGIQGSIINEGTIIAANHGLVALVGSSVTNNGMIQANLGRVVLASGDAYVMSFAGNDLINFAITKPSSKPRVTNNGSLIANGGQIMVTAAAARGTLDNIINMNGVAEAKSVYQQNGEIIISGDPNGGVVRVAANINASGRNKNQTGGNVSISGYNVLVDSPTTIDVSGDIGGGKIIIGAKPLSNATVIKPGVKLLAQAISSGQGGFVETSGHYLNIDGVYVNTSAPNGLTGTWLLDPTNIYIANNQANATAAGMVGTDTSANTGVGTNPEIFQATGSVQDSLVTVANLLTGLASNNVRITTTNPSGTGQGNITVVDPITWSSTNSLEFVADNKIFINNAISGVNGSLILTAANIPNSITTNSLGSINVANFNLVQGQWTQIANPLPSFVVANNFQINSGSMPSASAQFIRALSGAGSGPYLIADIYGLQGIGSTTATLSYTYQLANDLNATSTSTWNSGGGFRPIGIFTNAFSGQFNGLNHSITNLKINASGGDIGLFGYVDSLFNPTISNLTLITPTVSSNLGGNMGALIGSLENNGIVTNVHVLGGTVTQTGNFAENGGIIGYMTGNPALVQLTNASATVDVTSFGSGTDVGGLVGLMQGGTVNNSFATGDIDVFGTFSVGGGLVSQADTNSTILNSYATGDVFSNQSSILGGLLGWALNSASVVNSYATGSVTATGLSSEVGGLIGDAFNSGITINNSFATGDVTGVNMVGGLIGYNDTTVTNSYASGKVVGIGQRVGGLVGLNDSGGGDIVNSYAFGTVASPTASQVGGLVGENFGSITTSYASGSVTGGSNTGGFVGRNATGATITNSFWDTDSTGRSAGFGANTGTITNLVGGCFTGTCSNGGTANLSALSTYLSAGWNIGTNVGVNSWVIYNGFTRPFLSMENRSSIITTHNLQIIGMDATSLAGNYTLSQSFNLDPYLTNPADIWGNSTTGFAPIGTNANPFTGTFDGNNFTLSNLTINRPVSGSYIGLFGRTTNNISNLTLDNVNITGADHVGGLTGLASSGTISNVTVTGSITGNAGGGATYIGGLAGELGTANVTDSGNEATVTGDVFATLVGGLVGLNNTGTISNSYNIGEVTAESGIEIGGLVGENGGIISNSFNLGNVSAPSFIGNGGSDIGGLVGINGTVSSAGTIINSYSNAIVSGGSSVEQLGGLVGFNGSGDIINSYSLGAVIAGGSASNIGGLVGDNSGFYVAPANIINSYSNASVTVGGLSLNVGGLVGISTDSGFSASITGSHSTGPVNVGSYSSAVGGLVGANFDATINNSYTNSPVTVGMFSNQIGGLAGVNEGVISNTYSTGDVIAKALSTDIGGFAGENTGAGSITNSYSTGSVRGGDGVSEIGGFIGDNQNTISNSFGTGDVFAALGSQFVGGFAGVNSLGATIATSYSSGDVSTGTNVQDVGGFIGANSGTINDAYTTGAVTGNMGDNRLGGFAGNNSGLINRVYSSGLVSPGIGTINYGGLIGTNTGSVSNSYWDTITSGLAASAGGTGITTPNALLSSTYAGWNIGTNPNTNTWLIFNGSTRPMLAMEYGSTISTAHGLQLININNSTLMGSYTLAGNIDASGTSNASDVWNGSFLPIGRTTPFSGSLDGQHFAINALTLNLASLSNVGLFGQTANSATISNIGVTNLALTGTGATNIGGLVGSNQGFITNAFVTGTILQGNSSVGVGGLVGVNSGSGFINHSYSNVDVTAGSSSSQLGGFVGVNNGGSITDSYALGSVTTGTSANAVGGFAGLNQSSGLIFTSYSSSLVAPGAGSNFVGGFIGSNILGGMVSNNFWDTDTSNQANGFGNNSAIVSNLRGGCFNGVCGIQPGANSSNPGAAVNLSSLSTYQSAGWDITSSPSATATKPVNDWFIFDGFTRPISLGEWTTNVSNAHQLQLMGTTLGANYTLAQDIDMSASLADAGDVWGNSTTGFVPIGDVTTYSGIFSGANRTINNLTQNLSGTALDYVGLFGAVTGNINNLTLANVNIFGGNTFSSIGGVAGRLLGSGSLSNVVVSSGSVTSTTGTPLIGGLVGEMYGTIINSSSAANVSAQGSGFGSATLGGLVGFMVGGTINNSYAMGNVSIPGNFGFGTNAGGLAGDVTISTITNSYATGSVNGDDWLGGLIGVDNGSNTIRNTYALGNVTGGANALSGGLIGLSSIGTTIDNSFASGAVSGDQSGGLVGDNGATISNSYAIGTTIGNSISGGLVGNNYGTITNSYASGVTAGGTTGGFVGTNSGTITNSFWDTDATTRANGWGTNSGTITALNGGCFGGVCAIQPGVNSSNPGAAVNLSDYNTYAAWNITSFPNADYLPPSFDWYIFDGNTRPVLMMENTSTITNAHQLQMIDAARFGDYTLANNIDLSSALNNASDIWGGNSKGFVPLNQTNAFGGTFDGGGYTISNLTMNRPGENSLGLFGNTYFGAIITDIHLENVNIMGEYSAGALLGNSTNNHQTIIYNASSTGAVTVTDGDAGGLVGFNGSLNEILFSHSSANVDGGGFFGSRSGGLVGTNFGIVRNSYASGNVTGFDAIGGLVGQTGFSSVIATSFSSGNVTGYNGANRVGGLVGFLTGGSIDRSYSTGVVSVPGAATAVGGLVGSAGNLFNTSSLTNSYTWSPVNVGAGSTLVGGLLGDINNSNVNVAQTYSTGSVVAGAGSTSVGGLIGGNTGGGTVTDSFWDINTTGQALSAGGTGLTTTQLFNPASYPMSWDFTTVWGIVPNQSYAYLRDFYPVTPRAISGVSGGSGTNDVKLAINGNIVDTAPIGTNGAYYFLSGINILSHTDNSIADNVPVLTYLDSGSIVSNAITRTPTNGGSILNLSLPANTVTIGHNDTATYSNTDLANAAGLIASPNILYSVTGNNLLLGNATNQNINLVTTPTTTYSLNGNINSYPGGSSNITIAGPLSLAASNVVINSGLSGNINILGNVSGNGNALTLTNNDLLSTIAGNISGVSSLTKLGTGTLTLSGINTYNTLTNVTGGTLTVTNSASLGTSAVSVGNGATLELEGTSLVLPNAITLTNGSTLLDSSVATTNTLTGGVTLDNAINSTETINVAAADVILAITTNGISGGSSSNTLVKTGNGTLQLSAPSTYLGATNLSSGTLLLGTNNALPSNTALTNNGTLNLNGFSQQVASVVGNGTVTNTSGTASLFTINNATTDVFSGLLTGNLALVKTGVGNLILTTANTYTGSTTISAGTLTSNTLNALPVTALIVNGTFDMDGNAQTVSSLTGSGVVTNGAAAAIFTVNNTSPSIYNGTLTGALSLTKLGTGSLVLGGANSYTGATNINAGVLQLAANNAVPNTSDVTVTGTFDLNNFNDTIGSLAGSGNVLLGSGTLTTANNNSTLYSGVISGTGNFSKGGAGTLTLTNQNTYSGSTTLAGTIISGIVNALPTSTSLINNGTFDMAGNAQQVGGLSGTGVVTNSAAPAAFTVANNTTNTYNGTLTGALALTKSGTGLLSLGGANTYTGATNITNGILSITSAGGLGNTTAVTIGSGSELNINNVSSTSNAPINLNGGILSGTGIASVGTGAVTLTGSNTISSNNLFTLNGTINGGSNLTLSGAGTLIFNNLIGNLTPLTSITNTAGGTTFANNVTTSGSQSYTNPITLTNSVNFTSLGGNINMGAISGSGAQNLNLNVAGTTSTVGLISNINNFTKDGNGILTLNAANTYTGTTTLNSGTLRLGANNAVPTSTDLTVPMGTTFDLANFSQTLGSIAGAGNVLLGSGTLSTQNNTSTLFSGNFSGNGSFIKSGAGTTTLSGNNTYTGATTVNGGVLSIASATALSPFTSTTVTNNATLDINNVSVTNTPGITLNNGTISGNGTASLTAPINFVAGTTDSITTGFLANFTINGNLNGAIDLELNGLLGNLMVNGNIGNTTPLNSLVTNGSTVDISGNITTLNDQTYNAIINLANNVIYTSIAGNIEFAAPIDGGNSLTVNSAGTTTFREPVGDITPLSSLSVTASNIIVDGSRITTTGAQNYNSHVTLTGATSFTGTTLNLNSGVDGATDMNLNGVNMSVAGPLLLNAITVTGTSGNNSFALNSSPTQNWTVLTPGTGLLTSVTGVVGPFTFSNLQHLIGGAGADNFSLAGGSISGSINGGAGVNSLTGNNAASNWNFTGFNAGNMSNIGNFSNIQNVTGGTANDVFTIAGGSLSGVLSGGAGSNTLIGGLGSTLWNITSTDAGTMSNVGSFNSIQNLRGGGNGNNFVFANNATLTGLLIGGPNEINNAISWAAYGSTVTATLTADKFAGTAYINGSTPITTWQNVGSITGNNGLLTITPQQLAQLTRTGPFSGSIADPLFFNAFFIPGVGPLPPGPIAALPSVSSIIQPFINADTLIDPIVLNFDVDTNIKNERYKLDIFYNEELDTYNINPYCGTGGTGNL